MHNTKIKICGIQTLEDIQAINEAKPDYAGFVFAPGRHYVRPTRVKELKKHLIDIQCVGVVVDEPIDKVVQMIRISNVDVIQLHGHENKEYIEELATHITIPIWKAIRIKDTLTLCEFPQTEHIVLDSFTQGEAGGSGKCFNWELLEGIDVSNIWIAGGISLENVKDILSKHVYGVDISSGVERNGKKDAQKIKKFIDEVRAYA